MNFARSLFAMSRCPKSLQRNPSANMTDRRTGLILDSIKR